MKKKLVVLASGNGSNFQAIIDAAKSNVIDVDIVALVSDKENAYAISRAKNAFIESICVPYKKNQGRNEYDKNLALLVKKYNPDYIFLLGWMRILSNAFISNFDRQIINLHPALPETFPGTNAIERAFDAYKNGQITLSGVMTHFVIDEGVDSGPVIQTATVDVFSYDRLEDFEKRMHDAEHRLVVDTMKYLIKQSL